MKYTYEQLEALLLKKDFEALTAQERLGVGLSAQEYAHQRRILLASQQLLTPPAPQPILKQLQQQLDASTPTAWWQYSIPVYQVGLLGLLLLGMVGYLWPQPTTVPLLQEKIVYVNQVDTVVQEQVRIEEKIVYKIKKVVVVQQDTLYLMPPPSPEEREQFYQEKETDKTIFAKESKGKSLKEMPGLMDFVVGEE